MHARSPEWGSAGCKSDEARCETYRVAHAPDSDRLAFANCEASLDDLAVVTGACLGDIQLCRVQRSAPLMMPHDERKTHQ